ncbi:MAG: Xaa-Pro aminopeptidase [Natrialbaceae archaeon]|jgi:Xaa-Pro aminopeptidase
MPAARQDFAMANPFTDRTRRCQRRLQESGADAAVLFPSPNLYYVSGFHETPSERLFVCIVPAAGEPTMIAPSMYAEQLQTGTWIEDVRTWDDDEDPLLLLKRVATDLNLNGGRLLVDETMWATFTFDLRETLEDATFALASEVFEDLRITKDETELDVLRRAGALADEVSESIRAMGADAVGVTEAELARKIERRLADGGSKELAFEVIVGSGPNGAMPHHTHGDREIRPGEPVVLDFGGYLDRYPGDQTRTVVFDGEPPDEFDTVHKTVLEAMNTGIDAVEPGVEAGTIDRTARAVIEEAGYGDAFIHRTGHGVGLEVHEAPYIVGGNDRELEPGMVFSVEPGIYLEDEFGVRIEDLVVVTEDGAERLNDSPRTGRPL